MEAYMHSAYAIRFLIDIELIKKGLGTKTTDDIVPLLRQALYHAKQSYVKVRNDKAMKKGRMRDYKAIQKELRLLTW